jgi:fatty acid/phospholipid biosynthesis enzyme
LSDHLRTRLKGRLPDNEVDELAREVYELNNVVETLGGGPMFGVNGVSVIGHGRAMADAVQRAIDTARMTVASGFVEKLNQELATVRTRVGDGA